MENKIYKRQVALLLDVLPEVAKEECFALHGGQQLIYLSVICLDYRLISI